MAIPDSEPILRATRPGGEPPAPYDFARPRSFSDRHLRAAEVAHAALVEGLADALSAALGQSVSARYSSLDEVMVTDFEQSRTRPAALFAARLGEKGPALGIDLGSALALFFVERHLGGTDPLGTAARALSELEQSVVARHWLPLLCVAFAEGWGTVPPRPDRFVGTPEHLAIAPPDARVSVVDVEVTIGESSASLSLCYPAETLRALLDAQDSRGTPPPLPASSAPLDDVPLDLCAELGRTRVPIADLLRLKPGDVIPFDQAADAPVPVWVGDRFRFEARTGVSGPRLALQVLTLPAPPY